MVNLGTWVVLSLPPYFALTSRLKGRSQNIAVWVYLWGIGGLWAVQLWQLYQAHLAVQHMDLEPYAVRHQSETVHVLWISAVAMAFIMALPPFWYLRDKHKTRGRSTK